MNTYPEFTRNRPKGTIVKKVRNTYYVYYATSKKEEGKKYPRQIVTGLAGMVDEKGFHVLNRTTIDKDKFIVREYGFTSFILRFQDEFISRQSGLKKLEKLNLLYNLIVSISPNSYINEKHKFNLMSSSECEEKYGISFTRQINALKKMVELNDEQINGLKSFVFAKFNEKILYSDLTQKQISILEELGVIEDDIKQIL